ncbi:MAG: D-2-hydroxyacid dehydrogenase [Planctomycetia bacterium]|nr:D-2-hydroxyacid dehydrogenase [Planctomycetia bacterium]
MRMVVLDGYTANPGDLDDTPLRNLVDEFEWYERTSTDQILSRATDAEILLTNKTILDATTLTRLPRCRYIGVLATGTNVVDLAAARQAGITVTNVPAYSTISVAQAVFAHLLNWTHRVAEHSEWVREHWAGHPDFSFTIGPLPELMGRTFGIVGFGAIGRAVARIADAFGMELVILTRTIPDKIPDDLHVDQLRFAESPDEFFGVCDVVSLHCPLTPLTEKLINAERLTQMRRTAFLINTGRGGLVDEEALATALWTGQIAGAGLDVLSCEPPRPDNPLLKAPHCTITPHYAWATRAARQRLMNVATQNVRAFLLGQPENVVN